jgi:uncharacterized protein (DUF58 family)
METSRTKSQMTTLLSNEVLARVERLRIQSRHRFTNRSRGEHLFGKGGSSNEFSDYRDYVEGDDIRYIDWNIFSRLQRPYMKLYHHEEEMHVVMLVDASSSMLFEDKLLRAKQLAACFAVMGLFNTERVSVHAFTGIEGKVPILPPCAGRGSMNKVFRFLEEIDGGGDAPLESGIETLLKRHRGRGVVVLLSDFLTYKDLKPALNRLFSKGLEIFAVQVLGPTETDPDISQDLRLVDCEMGNTLDVSAVGDLLSIYQEYLLAYARNLELMCQQRSGSFVSIGSQDSIEHVMFDLLRRKGWVM